MHTFYRQYEKSSTNSYYYCNRLWFRFFSVCSGNGGSLVSYADLACIVVRRISYSTSYYNRGIFTIAGIRSANAVEPIWGEDPSRVVVDEMVGVWIPLLAAPAGNLWYALAAFALFRLFDIFKPLGIRKMEYLKGGVGVMMDDILAGIYSLILLIGARWLIG